MKKTPKILITLYFFFLVSAGFMAIVVDDEIPLQDIVIMQQKLINYPELRPFFATLYEDGKITKSEYNKFYNELFFMDKE